MKSNTLLRTGTGVAVVALALAACSSSKPAPTVTVTAAAGSSAPAANAPAATSVTAPQKAKKNYNIQFIQGVAGDQFYITMQCGAEAEAAKLGVTLKTQGPQKFDPTLQKPILDSVMATKPDAILIAPTDVTAMQGPLAGRRECRHQGHSRRHDDQGPVLRGLRDRLRQRGGRQGGLRGAQGAQPERRQGHDDVGRPRHLDHRRPGEGVRGRREGRLEVRLRRHPVLPRRPGHRVAT